MEEMEVYYLRAWFSALLLPVWHPLAEGHTDREYAIGWPNDAVLLLAGAC